MLIFDWSSYVCSSDLLHDQAEAGHFLSEHEVAFGDRLSNGSLILSAEQVPAAFNAETIFVVEHLVYDGFNLLDAGGAPCAGSCRVRMDGPNKSVALTVRIIEGRLFLE